MRIAVTYENGQVFQHFGHTERFKIYDVENGAVQTATTVNTNGSGHGALADILKKVQVHTLICGGIGSGARRALDEAGIQVYGGVKGEADAAVEALLAGSLAYDPDACCSHQGAHHGGSCGEHSCGAHSQDEHPHACR
ncbi:MAG: dinitrogenase iron-molybdenum cofactor biosynthesis protein [Clostridia bacterium]|nr:NifB/NifX family molybdenum-iron cluster-binding protein [Candidatus Pelethousia sp.]NCB31067.1 dinitrogenase iron-molybdenum cofactor biosynthesis protein [Clostridia bacterium]